MASARGIARFFGWLYLVLFVPAFLLALYSIGEALVRRGDVVDALYGIPIAILWPLMAVSILRGHGGPPIPFPVNVAFQIVIVAWAICGWTVLVLAIRDLVRRRR